MAIGDRIAQRRKALGMTQDELAKKVGYKSKAAVSKIETNVNDISQSQVVKFAEALDVSINYLMGWENPPDNQQTAQDERHVLVNELFDRLSEEDQRFAVDFLRKLSQNQ